MTEKQFQRAILDLCLYLGLLVYHTHDSRRSNPGFPDLVIVGPEQVIYAELKSEKGRISKDQQKWIDGLRAAGQPTYLWRPADLPAINVLLTDIARGRSIRV